MLVFQIYINFSFMLSICSNLKILTSFDQVKTLKFDFTRTKFDISFTVGPPKA